MRYLGVGFAALAVALGFVLRFVSGAAAQQSFTPVTKEMLANPSPDDWLMYSRTYDAQRFSPLKQITRQNVAQLRRVFKKGFFSEKCDGDISD